MQGLRNIVTANAAAEADYVRKQYPLLRGSLDQQIIALQQRGEALSRLFAANETVRTALPDGFWEEDRDLWCFCAAEPRGHELESVIVAAYGNHGEVVCLFRDGEVWDKLCPQCRRPCEAYIVNEVGGERDERWRSIRTKCCGSHPVRPNGSGVCFAECDGEDDE